MLLVAAACPYAGQLLIKEDPLRGADAIVVLAGQPVERWLEAVDLHREGYAPLVLLSPGYEDPLGDRLRARGIRLPREVLLQKDAMVQLGTPANAIEVMPGGYDNTAAEADGARQIAAARGWRTLLVVTSHYHTRRTRFAFQRELRGTGITAIVRGSRYDEAAPNGWWKQRDDLRWVMTEWPRLIAYYVGLAE